MACDQCFRLKVRCDAASPCCANCNRLLQECTYLRLDRRKISKAAVTQLIDRIWILENTLKKHSIPVPSTHSPKLRSHPLHTNGNGSGPSEILPRDSQSTQDEPGEGDDRERALIERMDKGNTLISELDPDIALLVKRTGSLQFTEHGQLKFFGTTSNVHFLRTAIPFQPHSRISADVNSPAAWLECLGVGHPVPRELEDHLIKLYFNWENPYFRVVDEDAFMDARRQALSSSNAGDGSSLSCYSEFLVNAMCSWGALFTDREVPGLPGPLQDLFLSRARALLERDIDNPTIATVQGLAMMSGSEASRSRDSRGWLYIGMASQMAHHLGLHLDVEHYVQSKDMTRQEANVRSTAFWGTYVVDLAWSYYLGRLVMPVADVNRNPVRIPSHSQTGVPRFWENYTDQSDLEHPPQQYIDPSASMSEYQLKLCYIMERLQKTLYDKRTGSMSQLRMHTSAVTWALDKWMDDLPPELVVDTNDTSKEYLPHVLVLHAQYHEAMIFANHPFITMPKTGHLQESQDKYAESARKITQIIQMYDRLWSLRRINIQFIHPMFTASMVHLYIACTSNSRDVHASAVCKLETCCAALKDVSQYIELAAWQLRSIDRVRQVWYDLLENQDHDEIRMTVQQTGRDMSPQGPERWAAIDAVTKNAAVQTEVDLSTKEQMAWYNTWTQIQAISDMDPFSMGFA